MPSRQFAHLQIASAHRLRAKVPVACPLTVACIPRELGGGFAVATFDGRDRQRGRFQVVASWIDGYVAAWKRTTRRST